MIRIVTALSLLLFTTAALAEDATPPKADDTAATPPAAGATATGVPAVQTDPQAKPPAEIGLLKPFTFDSKDTDMVYGKEDAPVTIVEYASLSCPHCAAFYRDVFPILQKQYLDPGKAKLIFRNYPLNQPALEAAEMVQCADKETRPTFVKVLFTTQEKWAYDANYHEALAGIAVLGGLERQKFDDCMKNKDIQSAIILAYQEAKDKYHVNGTPTLFVDGVLVKGNHSTEALTKTIDEAVAAAAVKK